MGASSLAGKKGSGKRVVEAMPGKTCWGHWGSNLNFAHLPIRTRVELCFGKMLLPMVVVSVKGGGVGLGNPRISSGWDKIWQKVSLVKRCTAKK